MSQLIERSNTVSHSIPIGRRISEIMKEKGKYYSRQAMAARLGISRTTFAHMLSGNRDIYKYELEKIAIDLKVPVSRILQDDIASEISRIEILLKELSHLDDALHIAQRLLSCSMGITERCYALNYLGRVQYELKNYKASHSYWLEARQLAEEIDELYGEKVLLHTVRKNLMLSYTCIGEYQVTSELIRDLECAFKDDDPQGMGTLCYTLAMIAYQRKDLLEAREHLMQSHKYYIMTGDAKEVGKAEHNLGYIEYKLQNYSESKKWYECAIDTFDRYPSLRLIPIKDYLKTLLKLGDRQKAEMMINKISNDIAEIQLPDLKAKFNILLSMITGQMDYAISVLSMADVNSNLKLITCRVLQNYYSKKDDAFSLLHYYKIEEGLSVNKSDVLDEEAL